MGNILVDDMVLIQDEEKAGAFFKHYDDLLGTCTHNPLKLDLDQLDLPKKDLSGIDVCFSEEEREINVCFRGEGGLVRERKRENKWCVNVWEQ